MLRQIIHKFWINLKSFFSLKNYLGLSNSATLKYEKNILEIDLAKLGFLLSSCDITNTTGKFTISQDFDDEKTEMFDVVCMVSVTRETGTVKITKTTRRLTFYRNAKGRLVNLTLGPPKVSTDEISYS